MIGSIDQAAGIDNVKDCIPKDEAIEKFSDLPPKSYECIAVLSEWEIDLSNDRHVLLKTEDDVEAHLFFRVPKLIITNTIDDIPVIHKSGWICLPDKIHDKPYKVIVWDNFHYMEESEKYVKGEYESYDQAVYVCKCMVNDYLVENFKQGMSADDLYDSYTSFGEDPSINPVPEGMDRFSAWNYAKKRCSEIMD